MTPRLLSLFLTVSAALGPAGTAQDADGDGMADALERVLGSDPGQKDPFVTILDRKVPANHGDPARFVAGAAVANAGGNRFIWRIEFGRDYPTDNSNLILYLDADDDPKTGRQPGHGCEFMLRVSGGRPGNTAWSADGRSAAGPPPRTGQSGRHLYVSYDSDLKQREGKSVFRLRVLSETLDPHRGVDSAGYFTGEGPPASPRPKIRLDSDLTKSEGVEQTSGPDRIGRILQDPSNVVLPIFGCEHEGFAFRPSEYRADNVVRTGTAGKIVSTVPRDGRFHPGFILYDDRGREVIGLAVNGRRLGVAVANRDDRNQHLFFLSAPVSLKKGDRIELLALGHEGAYRTEDVVLLAKKPDPRPAIYEFRHIAGQENRLAWVTTWPAACTIELEGGGEIREQEAASNHRLELPDLKPGQRVRYRIRAATREGLPADSGWRDYAWDPFREPATTRPGSVMLKVEAPPGAAPADWPVTGGVPFPSGVLGSARNLKLTGQDGRERPLQAAVTGRWPDGSVKWVLVDFRHSGAAAEYRLHYGPRVSRADAPARGGPPPAAGDLRMVDAGGGMYSADLSAGLSIEEEGALRTCHRSAGRLKNADGEAKFSYDVRLHRYPGTPWARVLLTFGNDASDAEFTTLRSLAWKAPVPAAGRRFVRQHTDDRYAASSGEGRRWSGPVGPLRVRDFWQNYPKDVEAGPGGATLWLLPPLKRDEYAWAKGSVDEHRLFFWFDPLPDAGGYRLRQGMTKTHEVWIGLDGSAPPGDRPLFPACTPRWYADSGAFGAVTAADPDRAVVRDYDAKVAETLDRYLKNREKNREYGLFNFGDWWGERVINWGNIEYDTQHAFFLQFVRSGDRRFLQAGEQAEIHNRDVDTVHHHADPRRVGRAYAHCIGHVGHYYDRSPLEGRNRGTPRGGFTVSHTWTEGHFDHYFLTGDRRSLETGLAIAGNFDLHDTINYDFTNCRIPGWHLILSLAAYRATGDPFHLNAGRIIVERVLERQTPEGALGTAGGGWRRRMVPGHCLCEPAHYGNAGFMVGVLMTGLRWYHQETGDPRVAESLHRGARFLIADLWEEDVKGFRYTSCPKSSKGAWSNFLLFDGMAYAWRLTGDRELARVLEAGTDSALRGMSGMGKSFSQYIRVAPHFIGTLADLREASK